MTKNKRQLDGGDPVGLDNVHASRKKRVKYTEEDANLAEIYNNLADEVEATRIKAAGDLIRSISTASLEDPERLQTAETRLIKGLCSGRKAARLGFSIALTELFRLKFSSEPRSKTGVSDLESTVDTIVRLTRPQGNVSGQEKRDHFLGQRFSFQALLQSDVGLQERTSDGQWNYLLRSIFRLASEKQWLRRECSAMVHEYLTSTAASKLSDVRIRMMVDELVEAKLAKTPEGVAIWLTVQKLFPEVKLSKEVWHHRDPLSAKELPILTKILLETSGDDETITKKSGARQSSISFAWNVILSSLYERDDKRLAKFWNTVVDSGMFSPSASAERRALGLQVLSLAISTAPAAMLPLVVEIPQMLTWLIRHRSGTERHLFDATKVPLDQMVARAKREPVIAGILVQSLAINGRPNFDQLTKSKVVEGLIDAAGVDVLKDIVGKISAGISSPSGVDQDSTEKYRRGLADLLLMTLRAHRRPDELFHEESRNANSSQLSGWAASLIQTLVSFGFKGANADIIPSMSNTCQTTMRARLMSCLTEFMNLTIQNAITAPLLVFDRLGLITSLRSDLSSSDRQVIETATQCVSELRSKSFQNITVLSFQLLFSLATIEVYRREPDSGAALSDLVSCYQTLKSESNEDFTTTIIELLLSFISKPSVLYKKLAQQVFQVFASQVTPEALQSLVDILEQRESLSGQQVLFDQQDGDGAGDADSVSSDGNEIDVEDASDVELVNGHEGLVSEAEDDGGSAGSSSGAEEDPESADSEDDEGAAFDKKLAEALGTAGMEDSDDDGSDMDDDQMMELEPHLASIFKERQKAPTNKKSDRKDAKENIINFKNRVLDLLMIYVKNQYHNIFALDLLLPLLVLTRTTTSKPTAEKAFAVLKQYFESCTKHKELPAPPDHEACFQLLTALHEETKLGGSKLHANACSRASLFLCKVLVGLDPEHYKRIAAIYAGLQAEWYLDEKSKILSSVFTEWMSWSINTRKHV